MLRNRGQNFYLLDLPQTLPGKNKKKTDSKRKNKSNLIQGTPSNLFRNTCIKLSFYQECKKATCNNSKPFLR